MDYKLKGKVAIVTGGASGIGKAAAERLAAEGAKVVIFDVNKEKGKEVAESIGGKFHMCNVSYNNLVREEVNEVAKEYGTIDIAFINAGINGKVTTIEAMELEDWEKTINTNLKSTFLCLKHLIPHMKKNGGSIIITSSINGSRDFSNVGMSAYATSKAGQIALGKMAALELAKYKIRVNIICPGAIDTEISSRTWKDEEKLKEVRIPVAYPQGSHPLAGRPGKPEQVADLVCFLSSDLSNHISGTPIFIDGAETLL